MKPIQRIAIVGAGALGALYADLFNQIEGCDVYWVADGERYDRLNGTSLSVNGRDLSLPVVRPEAAKVVDLIMMAVKHQDLAEGILQIKPIVGKQTLIMSVLNGLESEELLSGVYGDANVLQTIAIGMDAVREGHIVKYSTQGKLVFGEADNTELTDDVKRVQALFDQAKVNYDTPADMLKAVWWKFMVNVGVNQASAVTRSTYGIFQMSETLQQLMEGLMREVMLVAEGEGISLNDQDLEKWYTVMHTLGAEGKTSMLQDIEAGRKTEVDIFAGKVVSLAKKHGINVPINETVLRIIQTLESQY